MLTEISGNEIQKAVSIFRKRVAHELTRSHRSEFSHPGGYSRKGIEYKQQTESGLLTIFIVQENAEPTRYIHAVDVDRPDEKDSTLRLSISKASSKRSRSSTIFARNEKTNSIYICHKGFITIHRQRLKSSEVIDYFDQQYKSVVDINTNSKLYKAIKIDDLESPTLFEEIARYAKQIEKFKILKRSLF